MSLVRVLGVMRVSLLALVAFVAFGSVGEIAAAPEQAGKKQNGRPNVLLYVVCSLRADGLGNYGNFQARTPNADALSHDGTLFVNSYAPSSWTRPSVGSILTGVYPEVHRAQGRGDALAKRVKRVSERFAEQGWATGAIVTSPNVGSFYGFSQGFEDFIELYQRRKPGYVSSWEQTTRSDEVTRRAIQWIDAAERPFLLMVLTVDPHWPYDPLAEFGRRRGDGLMPGKKEAPQGMNSPADRERARAFYQAQVEFNDGSLGKLLEHLRAAELYDDTIVVLTSDHGEEFGEHGRSLHGEALFEESIRVPLIIRYPKAVPVATRVDRPVGLVDVAPTLLELAGLPGDDSFDGTSLIPSDEPAERWLYATLELDGKRVKAITRYPWKLIWNQQTNQTQLFNLKRDKEEVWDLAKKHPRLAWQLRAELQARAEGSESQPLDLRPGQPSAPAPDDSLEKP